MDIRSKSFRLFELDGERSVLTDAIASSPV